MIQKETLLLFLTCQEQPTQLELHRHTQPGNRSSSFIGPFKKKKPTSGKAEQPRCPFLQQLPPPYPKRSQGMLREERWHETFTRPFNIPVLAWCTFKLCKPMGVHPDLCWHYKEASISLNTLQTILISAICVCIAFHGVTRKEFLRLSLQTQTVGFNTRTWVK